MASCRMFSLFLSFLVYTRWVGLCCCSGNAPLALRGPLPWRLFFLFNPMLSFPIFTLPRSQVNILTTAQISAISIANSFQAYLTLAYTARVYSENPSLTEPSSLEQSKDAPSPKPSSDSTPPPTAVSAYPPSPDAPNSTVTPLTARIFGTWTLIQSLVRLYAAYNISNPQFYGLAFATYAVAWLHFMSEWWVFGTVKWGAPLAGPVFISTGSLVWMWMQWGWYVQ
jgi:hypothetical protein